MSVKDFCLKYFISSFSTFKMCSIGDKRSFGHRCSHLEKEKQVNRHCRTSKNVYAKNINVVKKGKELKKKKTHEDILV